MTIKANILLNRNLKYKNLLEWVKTKSIPERKKIIDEIKISNYFAEYDKTEVVIDD